MIRAAMLVALLAVAPAMADVDAVLANGFLDAEGDAPASLDLHAIYWMKEDADVTVLLDAALLDGAALTAVLFTGVEGEAEPQQAYILHHGPEGDRVLTSDGTNATLDVRVENATVHFDMGGVEDAGCTFAVARTVTYHTEGQRIEDVVGWSDGAIEDAWDNGSGCTDARRPVVEPLADGKSTPVPGTMAAVAVLGLAAAWRRTQR